MVSTARGLPALAFVIGTALSTIGAALGILEATYIATVSDPSRGALRTAFMITLLLAASVLTVPQVPRLASRWGYRRLYALTVGATAAVWAVTGLAVVAGLPRYPTLLVAVPFMGVLTGLSTVLAPLLCRAYLSGDSMAGAYARLSVIMGLSWGAGSLLGGHLLQTAPAGLGFLSRAALAVPLAAVLALCPPRGDVPPAKARAGRAWRTLLHHVSTPSPLRTVITLTGFVGIFALPYLTLIVPITAALRHVPLISGAGLLMAGTAVGQVFSPLFVTLLQRRFASLPAAVLASLVCAALLLAFAFASFVWTGENELAIWVLIGAGFGAARYTAKALELDAAVNSGVPDGEAVATLSFVKGACTPIGLLLWSMLITFASVEVTLLVASAGLAAGCAAVWTSYNRHARATAAPSAS